jgi:hypothetical protein
VTSLDRLITKKSKKKEITAPVLTVNDAVVKIIEAQLHLQGDTVEKGDGESFVVEKPHIRCLLELIDAPKRKADDIGTQWYESFYYPETKKGSGEYENRPGTKIGELTTARYGEGWEDDENIVLDPDDLPEFTFYCNLEPKTKFGSTEVIGTKVDHNSIEAVPPEEDEQAGEPEVPEPDFKNIPKE